MDCKRMGRPYREVNTLFSLEYGGMGSQLPKDIIVISLSNQILIKICHEAGRKLIPHLLYLLPLFQLLLCFLSLCR